MLTRRKGLAMTSSMPGKTLLINHFLINEAWYLVDLPGYGYARRGKEGREKIRVIIEDYVLKRLETNCLYWSCTPQPQKIDLEFIEWLGENRVPFAIVFTKADKLGSGRLKMNVDGYKEKLLERWEELPPIFITSSVTGQGREELLRYIEQINHTL